MSSLWDLVQKGSWHGDHQFCDHQHYQWLGFGVLVWGSSMYMLCDYL